MNLRWLAFEKSALRRVQQQLAAAPQLQAEYRRQRPRRLAQVLPPWLGQCFLATALAAAWFSAPLGQGGTELGLTLLALWSVLGIALQVGRLIGALHGSLHLPALYLLPLTDEQVFRVQWRRFVRGALVLVLLHLPAGVLLALHVGGSAPVVLASILLPSLHALVFTAVAVHCEALWPHGWHRHLGKLWLPVLALLFGWNSLGSFAPAIVQVGYWIPPFGWLNYVYAQGLLAGDGWAWTLLVPVALALWTLPWSWQRLRSRYHLVEPDWLGATVTEPQEELSEGANGDWEPAATGPTELRDAIRTGAWRTPLEWSTLGWFERWMAAWLSPRERLVAEFMMGGRPVWTPDWRRTITTTVLAAAAIMVLGGGGDGGMAFVGCLLLVLMTPVLGGDWAGFGMAMTGTMRTPLYALQPLGFGEIAGVMLKVNALRCLLAGPLLTALGALAGWRTQGDPLAGATLAWKAVLVVAALQPAVVAFRFSNGGSDTRQLRWYWIVGLALPILLLVGSIALVFMAESWSTVAIGLALTLVGASLELALYARLWGRGRFDLLCRTDGSSGLGGG